MIRRAATVSSRPPRSERAEAFIRAKPWLSLATIASVVSILTVVTPALLWVKGYFQTAEAARAEARENARRDAWAAYGISRLEAVILRNRVNECDERQEAKILSPAAVASCQQYRREFDAASAREHQRRDEALRYGKATD